MKNLYRRLSVIQKISILLVSMTLVTGIFLGLYRIVNGKSLSMRSVTARIVSITKGLGYADSIRQQSRGEYTNVIFLHHSVGRNLIEQGGVRELFTQAGIDFWDHDYNDPGLRNPSGQYLGYSYIIPKDNTDFDGLVTVFGQPVYSLPVNSLSSLLQHEVIIIKSCFPNSGISSEDELQQNKEQFLFIRSVMEKHPDKLFIVLTQPPLNPAETVLADAERARRLADWLKSDEFLDGQENLSTFDFFDHLAVNESSSKENNMLRPEYRDGGDSHPNKKANESIAPIIVDFVINAINTFKSD